MDRRDVPDVLARTAGRLLPRRPGPQERHPQTLRIQKRTDRETDAPHRRELASASHRRVSVSLEIAHALDPISTILPPAISADFGETQEQRRHCTHWDTARRKRRRDSLKSAISRRVVAVLSEGFVTP